MIFQKGQVFPSVKIITLHRDSTIYLEAFYTNNNELPSGVSPQISSFMV